MGKKGPELTLPHEVTARMPLSSSQEKGLYQAEFASTLTLDFPATRTVRDPLFKPPSHWYFVTEAYKKVRKFSLS